MDGRLNQSWWALKLAFGLVPIVAGLDKFFNLLTDWTQYLSPWLAGMVPATAFMQAVGVIEIVAGLLVLSKLTRLGAYVVAAWLLGIAVNLLTTGHFLDVAARDVVMAVGAFTLARLSEVRAAAPETEARRTGALRPAQGHAS
ncbi:DoxX family protein [Pyxidicoccus sp. MSG2]|uniref:DoxX family protein n=1 Tax=Pyxidicoccus sp. MSG2 TaxID=2996790 RepID=UPI002271095F|nr:DoxX family protein [Pyxidicoccus sp. MSG2]MCY1019652.1 DoxX family protein [Pyxidicoccus sp. MSG2]